MPALLPVLAMPVSLPVATGKVACKPREQAVAVLSGFSRFDIKVCQRHYVRRITDHSSQPMNQPVTIPVIEQLLNAERRYYVMLQQYAKALNVATPEDVERFRVDLCDAFSELQAAQDKLSLNCSS